MNQAQTSVTAEFKSIQVLHLALVIGAILMGGAMGFLISGEDVTAAPKSWLEGYPLYAAIIMVAEIAGSFFLWNSRQSSIPSNGTPTEKMAHYRSACILRWALLEGGILISIVLAFLDRNPAVFAVTAVGLSVLILAQPSKDFLADKYGLNAY